jgi:hypothetical protein
VNNTTKLSDCGCVNGNTRIIDPNLFYKTPDGDFKSDANNNFSVPQEDLSISVSLTARKKNRSVLTLQGRSETTSGLIGDINFIEGTDINGVKSLTTAYTDLSLLNESGNENLGISNINISFNSSMAPVISIDFIDVRGNALFQDPDNSPYNIFFELPYPIFNLTIKGYYGKPVSYCLHLIKFDSTFNSNNGNFEIKTQFIGYTYALLSDMLMGYIRAITNTSLGKEKFEALKADRNYPSLITIDELTNKIGDVNKYVIALTNSDPEFKELNDNTNINANLTKMKLLVDNTINDIIEGSGSNDKGLIIVNNPDSEKIKKNSDLLVNLIESLKVLVNDSNTSKTSSIKLNVDDFTNIYRIITNPGTNPTSTGFQPNQVPENPKLRINYLPAPLNPIKINTTDKIYFLSDTLRAIEKYTLRINESQNNLVQNVANKTIKEVSKTISNSNAELEPNIRNIVNIFTTQIEVFLWCLWKVSYNAESNQSRNAELNKLITQNGKIEGVDTILPWPQFNKKNGDKITEAWLGSQDGIIDSVNSNVDEVSFVNEFLEAMIKSYENEKASSQKIENVDSSWYSVSPFDNQLFLTENPYSRLTTDYTTSFLFEQLVINRMMVFLGVTYFNKITEQDIELMATLEAKNLFYNISDDKIKRAINQRLPRLINDLTTNIAVFGGVEPSTLLKTNVDSYEYDYFTRDDGLSIIPLSVSSKSKIYGDILLENNTNKLKLNPGLIVENTNKNFIGISNYTSNTGIKINNGTYYVKIVDDETYKSKYGINLPTLSSEESAIIGDIPQLKESDLKTLNFKTNKFSNGIQTFDKLDFDNDNYKPDNILLFSVFYANGGNTNDSVDDLYYYNGLGVTRFEAAKLENKLDVNNRLKQGVYDFVTENFFVSDWAYTYKSSNYKTRGSLSQTRKHLTTQASSYPYISFEVGTSDDKDDTACISLFGSSLYYNQTSKEAKSFLFLHTIPFNGMIERHANNVGLFSQPEIKNIFLNGGALINAPKLWAAFVGGLLWRKFSGSEFVGQKTSAVDPINFKFKNTPLIKGGIPATNQYLRKYFSNSPMSFIEGGDYVNLDDELMNLPTQVVNEFILQFLDFVKYDFDNISKDLEIIDGDANKLITKHALLISLVTQGQTNILKKPIDASSTILPTYPKVKDDKTFYWQLNHGDVINNLINTDKYSTISPLYGLGKNGQYSRRAYNLHLQAPDDQLYNYIGNNGFFLEIKDDSNVVISIKTLLNKTVWIANSTSDIWYAPITNGDIYKPISAKIDYVNKYLNKFTQTYQSLYTESTSVVNQNEKRNNIFGTSDLGIIKLNIYRHFKAIYDKWIAGSESGDDIVFQCGTPESKELIKNFRFINRSFTDIGNDFLLNPLIFKDILFKNENVSFADTLSRLLTANNFDFIPLPSFINFRDEEEMVNVFKPYPFNEIVDDVVSGPSFVCMYIGQTSNKLDLTGSNFSNDGFNFDCDKPEGIPSDFINETNGGDPISVFKVGFGRQNQNIFKNINLSQTEFTETEESLRIQDDISKNGMQTSQTLVGQNLFNVYQTRAYKASVEMLGNAMIQPMMYFQLDNIPMFRGAYLINKVTHSIKPNHMTTQFTGVRLRAVETPLIDKKKLYMSWLAALTNNPDLLNLNFDSTNNETEGGHGTKSSCNITLEQPIGAELDLFKLEDSRKASPYVNYSPKSDALRFKLGLNEKWMIEKNGKLLEAIANQWRLTATNTSYIDYITITSLSNFEGKTRPVYGGHQTGCEADIRPITNDGSDNPTSYGNPNYSFEGTKTLIQTIIDTSLTFSTGAIGRIWFNDPEIIKTFKDYKGKKWVNCLEGHDSHIHIQFNVPESVRDSIANGNSVAPIPNTNQGSVGPVAKIPNNTTKGLGAIDI